MSDAKPGTTTSQSASTSPFRSVFVPRGKEEGVNDPLQLFEARRLANWLYLKHRVHYSFEIFKFKKPTELRSIFRTDGYDVWAGEILVAIRRAVLKDKVT